MPRPVFFTIIAFVALTACAPFKVVRLPLRDADLYPLSQAKGTITVAVDEIASPDRARRYFGVDLIKKRILPISITVSNHGETNQLIRPSDILLRKGNEVIDPLPIEIVAEVVKKASGPLPVETNEKIDNFFSQIGFAETVLISHDTYRGVLFFPIASKPERDPFFSTIPLFQEGKLRLHIVITDVDTNQRTHFGPFPLTTSSGWM